VQLIQNNFNLEFFGGSTSTIASKKNFVSCQNSEKWLKCPFKLQDSS
jgi:hypothetical protein